jgi:hypothetical protein
VVVVANWIRIRVLGFSLLEDAAAAPSPPRRRVPWRAMTNSSGGAVVQAPFGPTQRAPAVPAPACARTRLIAAPISRHLAGALPRDPPQSNAECRARHMHNCRRKGITQIQPRQGHPLDDRPALPGHAGVPRLVRFADPCELVARFDSAPPMRKSLIGFIC